ncbi:hypothetical protein QBC35DRAFT_513286 [Podospora australis]|uniref:Transcription regulator Rua1 C-terminal domain-containing protein n=1 Tax=Podospora australis TaxID=1536484 RepID=A0AAN6X2M0_9PEZI|nr:hypothetical protein QBC35DRAFT_513286 [Podospora australis]
MDSTQIRQHIEIPSFNFDNSHNQFGKQVLSSHLPPPPIDTMIGVTMPPKTESMAAPQGVWTTPTSQGMRPRPATIHEGFSYCMPETYEGLPAWDTPSLQMQQTPSDISSRPISVHTDYYPVTTMESSESLGGYCGVEGLTVLSDSWAQKPCDDTFEIHGLDSDLNIGQAYTTDEAIPILDLRYPGPPVDGETNNFDGGGGGGGGLNPRRMSGSSFTVSTSGGLSEMASYEDFSTTLSEAPSFSSEYPPPSNRNSMMSSTQLSPVASPRMTPQSRSELVRTQSRGRASPSPRPGVRAAPYSVESARNKRWSTGSYGTANRRPSPFVYHHPHDVYNRMPSRHSSPTIAHGGLPLNYGNLQAAQQHPYLMSNAPFQRNSMLLPTQLPSHGFHPEVHQFENAPPLLSHGLFRMLQSNADPHSLHSHYADLSDPPDLYASLQEEQIPPPPEDMNPSDPDLVPHEQELRFEGDLYTPRWVRGHGNKREGWCGICKPGRWLVLKNSAFWYDKSFTHGISAATGSPFQEPQETRRMDGNPDVWEGLCGSCNEWIALVSSKKKGTTWFRHAYKCHTHPKIKDAPKRRRESNQNRNLAATNMAKPKTDPLTPQGTPAMSTANTPTPVPAQVQSMAHSQNQAPAQNQCYPSQLHQQQQQQHPQEQQSHTLPSQHQPPQQQPPQIQQTHVHPHMHSQPTIQLQPPPMRQFHRHLPPHLHLHPTSAPPQPPRTAIMSPIGHIGQPMDGFANMI